MRPSRRAIPVGIFHLAGDFVDAASPHATNELCEPPGVEGLMASQGPNSVVKPGQRRGRVPDVVRHGPLASGVGELCAT